jgi:hypothetical protein
MSNDAFSTYFSGTFDRHILLVLTVSSALMCCRSVYHLDSGWPVIPRVSHIILRAALAYDH